MAVTRIPRRFRVEAIAKTVPGQRRQGAIVRIFDGDSEIGSYERDNAAFARETFEPFELEGAWYALYARDFTASRVMSLPDCRDLGGEEPHTRGFIPVEFWVPRYRPAVIDQGGFRFETWGFESTLEKYAQTDTKDEFGRPMAIGPWQSLDFGFVAGCIWGDENTWKLEVIDVSGAKDGIISRTERFGYLELAGTIADSVTLSRDPGGRLRATILRQQDWDALTGRLVER
jgi:hypothetical protein